jgi:hypothetical protein
MPLLLLLLLLPYMPHLPAPHCLLWPVEPVDLQLHVPVLRLAAVIRLDDRHNLANLQQPLSGPMAQCTTMIIEGEENRGSTLKQRVYFELLKTQQMQGAQQRCCDKAVAQGR